jgi:radical SAM superfamily enzyme YgiQ (UPF0313 family)
MNILFVENKLRTDKLGICYLSSILKEKGHNVEMVQDQVESIDRYIENNPVDILMYSVLSGEHNWYLKKNRELKKKFGLTSIVGGPHFTFFPEDAETDQYIDHVVIGPGEEIIVDLVEGKITDKVVRGKIPNINQTPSPDRSILYKYDEFGKAGMKRFIAKRDCKNRCSYCFNHLYHKLFNDEKDLFFQQVSPDKFIDEIKKVKKEYGLKIVYLNDDDIASDKNWLNNFLEIYRKEINLPFCGSVRANSLDEKTVKDISQAGGYFLNLALESSNEETQRILRRGRITNEQIIEASEFFKKYGIKMRLQNMIGLPVENPLKDALETLKFNQELDPFDSWCSIFQPFKKTDAWKLCLEKKLIDLDTDCINFYEGTQLNIPNKKEINNLHKWWYFAIAHKLPIEFLKIILKQELSQDIKKEIQDYRWEKTAKEIYKL